MLIGEEGLEKLLSSRVCVFGVGGVGSYAVEALARSGVGKIDLVDADTVCESNINRQIIATHKTLGMYKVDAEKERILEINPNCEVNVFRMFYLPENAGDIDMSVYDYVVDSVDTVTAKIEIIKRAKEAGTPVISSMGAANKLDPTAFEVADIYKTQVCPLAKVMRRELKKRGIESLKVVYSREEAIKPLQLEEEQTGRRVTPASIAFVPSVAGLIVAGEVIKDLVNNK
jgi:tRNA A37 threonylcarbamoyladenosine dehydratase